MKTWLKANVPGLYYRFYATRFTTMAGHNVEYAFSCEGERYYCFTTGYSAYYERYMACLDKINELQQNVDKELLVEHCARMREFLNKGELTHAAAMNEYLAQRLDYMGNVELLYKLASAWYFTDKENLYTYDPVIGDQKIEIWKRHKEALAFFLKNQLEKFMPSPAGLLDTIQNYTEGMNLEELGRLRHQLPILLKMGAKKDTISLLQSRMETLQNWLKSNE